MTPPQHEIQTEKRSRDFQALRVWRSGGGGGMLAAFFLFKKSRVSVYRWSSQLSFPSSLQGLLLRTLADFYSDWVPMAQADRAAP